MKRLYLILLLAAVTLSGMAQTVGEAFYIYRNDGQFNAFFRDEVISIDYSYEDADGNTYDEIVTQIVNTADSVYKIPLAVIDSISFVQAETEYREGAVPLTGSLFDYLVSADGLTLTFSASLPLGLTPQVGDKLVNTDVTSKLPCGFVGQVRQVSSSSDGIKVQCDSIGLGDAVTKFYGVYDIAVGNNRGMRVRGPRKAQQSTTYPYDLPFGRTQLPPIDISAFVTEKNIFDINYKNTIDITFTPVIHIKVTRVIDDNPLLSFTNHTNLLVTTDADVEMSFDVSGEASKEWKKSFLPKQDFIIPPGVPLYFDIGVKASLSGEIATAFTTNSHVHQVTDITYYDVSLLPVIGDVIGHTVNRVDGTMDITSFDMNWDYLGFRAELKPCVYLRVGLSAVSHVAGWVGGEFDGGVKMNGELMFDFRRLQNAEQGTAVYDELKDIAKIDVKPYAGAHFMAAVFDDRYSFSLGKPFENPRWTWYQGRILPAFSRTTATPLSETTARVTANVTNDCFIPYTVGFALFDKDNNHVQTKQYDEKYWTRNAFSSYSCDFDGLDKTKKYKVYPIIRFFGKYDMLASPSADLGMHFPVTLSDFKVTNKQHKENGFTHEGVAYDYRFDVTVTATLDDDAEGIAEWGYVYLDPNGKEAFIPLNQFGHSYTDMRYAYFRNGTPPFTCTLYGYVKYVGSDEPVYGEPHDYPLEYGETTCPDANHPHMIDLGLPSGTKWACCNVGASTPEGYGNYYAWGETQPKSVYNWSTYRWGGDYDELTKYCSSVDNKTTLDASDDAATVNWGAPWRMPSLTQIQELFNNTTSTWTTQNSVKGWKFTGPNGGTIFLPAAGYRWDGELYVAGSNGYYWSSTLYESNPIFAYGLLFDYWSARWVSFCLRSDGFTVRPVR